MKINTIEDNNKLKMSLQTWDEFKEELDESIRKSENKKFKKEFKKIKKELRKDVKAFVPWDYDYLLNFIEHSLKAMSLFLGNKYLVVQDTEDEFNNWKEATDKLKECYNLLKDRNSVDNIDNEQTNISKALRLMSKHIFSWWD